MKFEVPESKIADRFKEEYSVVPAVMAWAPGRLEILGNHTDYNEGFVLSMATDLHTVFAAAPVNGSICKLNSFDHNLTAEFDLNTLSKVVLGDWNNYIKGVVYEISKLPYGKDKIKAFNAGIMSTVPFSAGMSSSAALEMSACLALGKLFEVELLPEEWARLGQRVENDYLGLKSGLLDQFSSLFGQKDHLIFCDFRENKVLKRVKFPHNYEFVVANSMVKHDLVDSDYNSRRTSCENVVEIIIQNNPYVKALRDVSLSILESCKGQMNFVDYKRAQHIIGENERVVKGVKVLENNDIEAFGELMFESHRSSIENFENSCPELDYLVELSKSIPGCIGARLSGGGFGGISIHLVKKNMVKLFKTRLKTAFKIQTGIDLSVLDCCAGDGARLVDANG
jgi:galactokinase